MNSSSDILMQVGIGTAFFCLYSRVGIMRTTRDTVRMALTYYGTCAVISLIFKHLRG